MQQPPEETPRPLPSGMGEATWLRRREDFYERVLGPMREPAVYHWDEETDPHIDVYRIGPGPNWPVSTLITGGMADRPQPGLQAGEGSPRRLELLMRLDAVDDRAAEFLRQLALLPFLFDALLLPDTLLRGEVPIRPGSVVQHVLLLEEPPETGLTGFVVEGEEVRFLRVCLVTEAERLFGEWNGLAALLRRLDEKGWAQVAEPDRLSVV